MIGHNSAPGGPGSSALRARLFGTDGIRGLANGAVLTPELALSVASAAARVLARREGHRPLAIVARDPRASGEMLEAAVNAGLAGAGAEVLCAGVLPTPAVAHLVAELDADLGVMLSASHNPMPDNGIKLFARGGEKLPDSVENAIESAMADESWSRPVGASVGRIRQLPDGAQRYIDYLIGTSPQGLSGLRVVVDCAHGAASHIAPQVYRSAGATVIPIAAEPDGLNINDGVGSTHMDGVARAVREHRADVGLAHDGDADRCLAVTADGELVDGDQILAILALSAHQVGRLHDDALVATVMSNLGLHLAMREHGIEVVTTAVGDRYVLEALRDRKLSLGGEQSGHVIMPEYSTTGDGILTGLHVLAQVASSGRSLAELAAVMERLPQVLINVPVSDKSVVAHADTVLHKVSKVEDALGDHGRVLLRPSGTEQLVRVMVEAPTQSQAQAAAEELATVVASAS